MTKRCLIRSIVQVVAALALGYAAGVNALGNILAWSDPELALSIDASNEFAYDKLGTNIVSKSMLDKAARANALPYVRRALELSPGLPASLRNYALLAADQVVEGDAIAIMKLAAEFSKRDKVSVLWLIEISSRMGDTYATLKYYDQALTAKPKLRKTLFPILAQAIADPTLIDPITRMILRKPEWSENFISYMAHDPKAVANLILLERALPDDSDVPTRSQRLAAGKNLMEQGQYAEAEQLLLPADVSLNGDLTSFAEDAEGANAFQWVVNAAPTYAIRSQADDQLRVAQYAGSGDIVANRIVMPKGRVQFRAILTSEAKGISQMPVFLLRCLGTAKSYRIFPQKRRAQGQFFYELNESVPDCYFAKLTLQNSSNFSGRDITYSVSLISLRRAGG